MAEVEVERRGSVEILRINRPEASNSLNGAVMSGLGFGVSEADADPSVKAIVITGTGDRAFCAGMDLRSFAAGNSASRSEHDVAGAASYQKFRREGNVKPIIGAANGSAVGGGFELLLACDLVVAASGAHFGLPEVKRSLFPAGGGVFLGRRIPIAVALELMLTGDSIGADRALELGLINRVVAADSVLAEAVSLAERIATNGPLAVTAIKALARAAVTSTPEEVWSLQEKIRPGVFGSADAREGAAAFIEKRPPVWHGR